jgi:hypothetical protein
MSIEKQWPAVALLERLNATEMCMYKESWETCQVAVRREEKGSGLTWGQEWLALP